MQYSVWANYSGQAAIYLAVITLIAAVILVGLGLLVRRPRAAIHGGVASGVFIALIWVLSALAIQWASYAYAMAISDERKINNDTSPVAPAPANPISKFTVLFALIVFVIIFFWTRKRYGWKTAIVSGIAGAGAGPVMFEFPFDWIIMWHLTTPTPVVIYRWVYFLPLFIFILATLAILTLTPAARLRRQTLFALAAMFLIWAGWAAFAGFGYPLTVVPTIFNVSSKLAAAVAGLMIFLPVKQEAIADARPPEHAAV